MSEPDNFGKENPYRRAYRYVRTKYHYYTNKCWTAKQTIGHYYRARREAYGGWEQEKKVLEVLAVVFIFVYTSIQGCQLWLIRDQEKRQLRAYIGIIDDIILTCPLCDTANPDKPIRLTIKDIFANKISIQLQNGGLTPAYNGIVNAGAWQVSYGQGLPKDFNYPYIPVPPTDFILPSLNGIGYLNPGEKSPVMVEIGAPLFKLSFKQEDTLSVCTFMGRLIMMMCLMSDAAHRFALSIFQTTILEPSLVVAQDITLPSNADRATTRAGARTARHSLHHNLRSM
jgi:hypothetical protein